MPKDKEAVRQGKAVVVTEDTHKSAPPPDFDYDSLPSARPKAKLFQPAGMHSAAKPDWPTQVAAIKKELFEKMSALQMNEEFAKFAAAQESVHDILPDMQDVEAPAPFFLPATAHSAPPPPANGPKLSTTQSAKPIPGLQAKRFA